MHGSPPDRLVFQHVSDPHKTGWMRHAKAGELAKRFTHYHVADPNREDAQTVPTYRGEGHCFG